jgi:hypothetical protein
LVCEGGIILVNDYGQTESVSAEGFTHQHFSQATFVGVNFPLLEAFFNSAATRWFEPKEGTPSVHARLVGNKVGAETVAVFQARFGKAVLEELEQPLQVARECLKQGALEGALSAYTEGWSVSRTTGPLSKLSS